jgi:tRNA (guanine26-N2/guanine27-N2)-dimethyltransferase
LAAKLALHNVEKNNLENIVKVTNMNANLLLQEHSSPKRRFDVIDLDPFGSPVPFLDSSVSALKDGGLLAVTATDMAPLCGVHPWACLRKYGAVPLRTEYCHELAVRILLGSIVVAASHHDLGMGVLVSHSTDHYIRAYLTCCRGAKKADQSISSMGYVSHCFNCFHREISRGFAARLPSVCPECGEILRVCGPLWTGALANSEFCIQLLEKLREMGADTHIPLRIIEKISKEADAPPTYYVIDRMCDKFNLPIPRTEVVMEEIVKRGYNVVGTHFNSKGLKSECPAHVIKEAIYNGQT